MNLYTQLKNGNRTAVIEKDPTLGTGNLMSRWYVTMSIEGNTIQKTATLSEREAITLAEDFVHFGDTSGPSLLNETISNG
jgi:hypothetical protein